MLNRSSSGHVSSLNSLFVDREVNLSSFLRANTLISHWGNDDLVPIRLNLPNFTWTVPGLPRLLQRGPGRLHWAVLLALCNKKLEGQKISLVCFVEFPRDDTNHGSHVLLGRLARHTYLCWGGL